MQTFQIIFSYLPYAIAILWLIRSTKIILFYLYLWQLKEYHLGRFLTHFRTEKGKILLVNNLTVIKILFIAYFFLFPFLVSYALYYPGSLYYLIAYYVFPAFLIILYAAESLKAIFDFISGKAKIPSSTKKTLFFVLLFLALPALLLVYLFNLKEELNSFSFWLLLIDLYLPVIVSAMVLSFQPFTVFLRWLTIQRAKTKREQFKDLLVIGITGSYGKTSTKEFLYTILSQKFNVLKTKSHQNSEIGVSQCILKELTPDRQIFIAEMGAYGRGGIKLLCSIAKPKVGILTGVNEQHLALFGSQKNIIKAKYELIESLPESGLAIFNGDNKFCVDLYRKTNIAKRIVTSKPEGLDFLPDIWAEGIIMHKNYITLDACTSEKCIKVKAYLSGIHFIPGLLSAILLAEELGMTSEEISEAILKIHSLDRTMNIFEGVAGLTIIDDTYSANPEGVFAALDYIKNYRAKKIIIMPSLIELGKAAKETHQKIGQKISEICDMVIVTTKDHFQEIGEEFIRGGGNEQKALYTEDPKEIINILREFCDPGDIVLLEGRVPNALMDYLVPQV